MPWLPEIKLESIINTWDNGFVLATYAYMSSTKVT